MEPISRGRSTEEKRAAFEAVAVPLMKVLYNRALNLARRPDVAADLVQETCLRAFRTFDNFTPGSNAKAWLLTILYSVFVNRYRKQQREPESISLVEATHTYSDAVSTEDALERRALLDPKLWASSEVNAALNRIPGTFRTLLLMVDVDDFTYEEAAASLQCPVGTVRSRLSRARKMLYVELRQYAQAHGFGKAER
jgi:RNA polymerase sigma-70 factor (ECF subfamily)